MMGRFLALALIATAPFLAQGEARPRDISDISTGGGALPAWARGHMTPAREGGPRPTTPGGAPMAGATYFIDAAWLADLTFTTATQTGLHDGSGAHPGHVPGLTLVLNRAF